MRKLDRLRSAIGKRFVVKDGVIAGKGLTQESLLHFALSTGNLDPLYYDAEYAAQSARGRLLPPPTWYTEILDPHVGAQALYTDVARSSVVYLDEAPIPAADGDSGPPYFFLDNLRSFNGALGFRQVGEPRLGDTFSLAGEVGEVVPKTSQRFGSFAIVRGDLDYVNADGTPIVEGYGSSIVYDLGAVSTGTSQVVTAEAETSSGQQVVSPIDAIRQVRRRGELPRHWEDVRPGDQLDSLFKGTLDAAEIAVYSVRHGQNPLADGEIEKAWRLLAEGDGVAAAALYREIAADPRFGFGVARHLNKTDAADEGAPGAYDIGSQRAAWAAQVVTDWMGNAGAVVAFSLEIRGFLVIGDSAWCKGTVASKSIDGERHLVQLDIWVENQRGERVSKGTAEVSLPTRPTGD